MQPVSDVIAGFRRTLTPTHSSGYLAYKISQLLREKGFLCTATDRSDTCCQFSVFIDGRRHIVTVEPDMAQMRAEMAA